MQAPSCWAIGNTLLSCAITSFNIDSLDGKTPKTNTPVKQQKFIKQLIKKRKYQYGSIHHYLPGR